MNARDRIEVPTTSWKLSRLNPYLDNGANEKRVVGVGEKLAGPALPEATTGVLVV
jgi:hypothetical protein